MDPAVKRRGWVAAERKEQTGFEFHGVDRGESNGGFVEFGDVGLRVGRLNGVWGPGSLWNSSRGLRIDASADSDDAGEGTDRSGAGVLTELSVFRDQFSVRSLHFAGAARIAFQR